MKHEGKYYFNCNMPSWPKVDLFDKLIRISDENLPSNLSSLAIAQIGFTKKCPLNCEHCYEGKILNQPENISLEEHVAIVAKLQENNIPTIQFGGGEPMNRYDDLVKVLERSEKKSDFWIYTSGFGLNEDKAKRLKQVGLTGISISIDHYEKEKHNTFRRNDKSFEKAITAVKNAQKANLLTALSICVTKDFCTEENLFNYLHFANSLNVSFVQLLEPRATGNYEGQEVLLSVEQIEILESFYISINTQKKFRNMPIVQYTGFQQRKKGCAGAGNRYIYIDTDGYVQSCPFCRNKKSHFLNGSPEKDLSDLKREGCAYDFKTIKNSIYA